MTTKPLGGLVLAAGLAGLPKPDTVQRPSKVMIAPPPSFLSMCGVAGSQVRQRLGGHGMISHGLYKKEGYEEYVSVVQSSLHSVTFIPLGCGTTAAPQDAQQPAETLDAEVFQMVYKPYNVVYSQKA